MNSEIQTSRVLASVNRVGYVGDNGTATRLQLSSARKTGFERLLERRAAAMAQIEIPDITDIYYGSNSHDFWESALNPFADMANHRRPGL
jgi:hypothetical protein